MLRYIFVFSIVFLCLTSFAQAQSTDQSRAPYTVTKPGGITGLLNQWMPWSKTKQTAAKDGKNITAKDSPRPKTRSTQNEALARQQKEQDAQMAALEKMRLSNAKKAAELNKRDAEMMKKAAQARADALPAPASANTGTAIAPAQAQGKPKTIYVRPSSPKPSKVFSGEY